MTDGWIFVAEHFGDKQKIVAIEELAELQKEITKDIRGKGDREHIIEELVDAEIMLFQLRYIYRISETEMRTIESEKFMRTMKFIKEDEKHETEPNRKV